VDSFDPEAECGDEDEAGEVVAGEFIVAGGDGTEVLHAAEGALNDVAHPVGDGVEGEAVDPVALVGDHRARALGRERPA
jgi:hypothetical protein